MSNLPDDKFTWTDDDLHRLLGHALLSYYGAANPPWCRILVIGHEPDTDERMGIERELRAALEDADRRPSECEGERERGRFAGAGSNVGLPAE